MKSKLIIALILMPFVATAADDATDARKAESAASLKRMRNKAAEFSVSFVSNRKRLAKLHHDALFRYSDQTQRYVDAALWLWEVDGVPVALAKVEDWEPKGMWQYCVASLSTDLIRVTRPGQQAWESSEPIMKFQPIPKGPDPAETPVRRLLQMKALSRRFDGTFRSKQQPLRPLPRPIHRYSHQSSGLTDACIFSFAINGTNPTALVVIALREDSDNPKRLEWNYSIVGMTSDSASVRLDGREVWKKALNYQRRFYENWYWHLERRSTVGRSGE